MRLAAAAAAAAAEDRLHFQSEPIGPGGGVHHPPAEEGPGGEGVPWVLCL